MYKFHKPRFKRDLTFGIGEAVGGVAGAASNFYAANKQLEGSKYAADLAYQGATATNQANIQIANDTNAANMANVRATNQANLDIQNSVNAANRSLAEQQNQWNIEQWNRQNEYNSPANQVDLYRAAGLNPASAAGGFSPAQELQSADLANQQVGAPMQAPQATAIPSLTNPHEAAAQILNSGSVAYGNTMSQLAKDAASVAHSIADISNSNKDVRNKTKMSDSEIKKNEAEIDKMSAETFNISQMTPHQIAAAAFTVSHMEEGLKGIKLDNDLKRIKSKTDKLQFKILQDTSHWLTKIPEQMYNNMVKDFEMKVEQIRNLYDANEFYRKFGTTREGAIALQTAIISADASKYSADKSFQGTVYSSNNSYLGSVYSADKSAEASKYSADKSAEASKYSADSNYNSTLRKFEAIGAGLVSGTMLYFGKGKIGQAFNFIRDFNNRYKSFRTKLNPKSGMQGHIYDW